MNLTRTQWNLLANLVGQGANAGLAFLVYPWFLHTLGQEAFGIVGFHISLQGTITLFDFGISVAANRELARLSAQPNAGGAMRSLVATLQRVYWLMAIGLGGALFLLAPILATHWLNPQLLDPARVTNALRWMALAVALQWPTFFYANCISGLQRQTLLNAVQVLASIARFPGTLLLLFAVAPTLDVYFVGQCCASFAQTAVVLLVLWGILPRREVSETSETIEWPKVRAFAAGVASISILTLILTQYDKLILSALLPLKEFSYYSQAFTLVSGLGIVSLPIGAAVFPRFSQLAATHAWVELREIYHHASQLMAALLVPLSVTMIVFADAALYVWTGSVETAEHAALVMRLLTFAMTLYFLLMLPGMLQYAHGQTRLSFWINCAAVAVYVPLGYVLACWAGGAGAAAALGLVLLGVFTIGVALVHHRLLPGDVARWYADIALPLAPVLAINLALWQFGLPASRIGAALTLVAAVLVGAAASLAVAPVTRNWLRRRFA